MPALRKVKDDTTGWTRRRCGQGFSYLDAAGQVIRDKDQRARIAALAIPPAWRDVWISPDPLGHILATGCDQAGRKQYIYHPDWQAARAAEKFARLPEFGAMLPRLRRKVAADLSAPPGSQRFALAVLVRLIDHAALRIGSARYQRKNGTYGATTLRARHIRDLGDGRIALSFTAKGGKRVRRRLQDARLHRALDQLADLPGAALFSWVDETGDPRSISARMVNDYLAELCDDTGVTAKTFRTWSGSVAALAALRGAGDKASITRLCEEAAKVLHNTPAICRASYIHPAVFALLDTPDAALTPRAPRAPRGLLADERRLMAVLGA
jgi:DNA topoisomerase-1